MGKTWENAPARRSYCLRWSIKAWFERTQFPSYTRKCAPNSWRRIWRVHEPRSTVYSKWSDLWSIWPCFDQTYLPQDDRKVGWPLLLYMQAVDSGQLENLPRELGGYLCELVSFGTSKRQGFKIGWSICLVHSSASWTKTSRAILEYGYFLSTRNALIIENTSPFALPTLDIVAFHSISGCSDKNSRALFKRPGSSKILSRSILMNVDGDVSNLQVVAFYHQIIIYHSHQWKIYICI